MRSPPGFLQGYNAQAVCNDHQVVLAAEFIARSSDGGLLEPMIEHPLRELHEAGIQERPGTLLADAGYWHSGQITAAQHAGLEILVPPDRDGVKRHAHRHMPADQQMRDGLDQPEMPPATGSDSN